MLSAEIRQFMARTKIAIVASADSPGQPHLALGTVSMGAGEDLLIFENWLCKRTMDNIGHNPQVAIAALVPEERIGYQFRGRVINTVDVAMADGYQPGEKPAGDLQILTRLIIRVENVTAFCAGLHVDR